MFYPATKWTSEIFDVTQAQQYNNEGNILLVFFSPLLELFK